MVCRLLDSVLAEDITNAVSAKAVANYDKFDPPKASFTTWVMRIAHSTLVDCNRSCKENTSLDDLKAREPATVATRLRWALTTMRSHAKGKAQ